MTLYFAYGSNMDLAQMAIRCPSAVTLVNAELLHHRFIVNTQGVGTVIPDPGSTVHGRLWRLTPDDERALDRYEGVAGDLYRKEYADIQLPDGRKDTALIYVATNSVPGKARPGYMEKVIAAAGECGLPQPYIDQLLKPWLRIPPNNPQDAL